MGHSSSRWANSRATAQANRANQVTTLFIHNLLEKMHWKGLWATFGHHGDVVDTFIPAKRSRKGKRFGLLGEEGQTQQSEEVTTDSEEGDYLKNNKFGRFLKRREKRYGSMREFQDRVLTETKKKKRDRALRQIRKKEDNTSLGIEHTSLSSSDLRQRQKILIREARKTIEFGHQIGFEIEGDTEEAIRDMKLYAGKWAAGWDFNTVSHKSERCGCSKPMIWMESSINYAELIYWLGFAPGGKLNRKDFFNSQIGLNLVLN
ncbi:hypothetical protein GQ457_06G004130 [Hibiscus cannabinus]